MADVGAECDGGPVIDWMDDLASVEAELDGWQPDGTGARQNRLKLWCNVHGPAGNAVARIERAA